MLDTRPGPVRTDLLDPARAGDDLVAGGITDEELTALALAADPDAPLEAAAVPDPALRANGPLPMFYMPPATGGVRERSRVMALVALILVVAFIVITALGFCITYGQLVFA